MDAYSRAPSSESATTLKPSDEVTMEYSKPSAKALRTVPID
jgi:hypothetical protein